MNAQGWLERVRRTEPPKLNRLIEVTYPRLLVREPLWNNPSQVQ